MAARTLLFLYSKKLSMIGIFVDIGIFPLIIRALKQYPYQPRLNIWIELIYL